MATLMVPDDETPQQAAERIWLKVKPDTMETMRQFAAWACESPERMLAVMGEDQWLSHVRHFLGGHRGKPSWRFNSTFRKALYDLEKKRSSDEVLAFRKRAGASGGRVPYVEPSYMNKMNREYRRRKRDGLKSVRAHIDVDTGRVVDLIDSEIGPFKDIRIRVGKVQYMLAAVTPEQALTHCDNADTESRFVRALCGLIPNPLKPIGEQWTKEMVQEARKIAERGP